MSATISRSSVHGRCAVKPPLTPFLTIRCYAVRYLPLTHEGRVFTRTLRRAQATDEQTGKVLWLNPALCFMELIWGGKIVAEHYRVLFPFPDDFLGFALADVQSGSIERLIECPEPSSLAPVTLQDATLVYRASVKGEACVCALDLATGGSLWQWRADSALLEFAGLAADPQGVYFGMADGGVVALGRESGKVLWRTSVADLTWAFGTTRVGTLHGVPSTSGDLILFEVHSGSVVALSARDGERAWVWRCVPEDICATSLYGGRYHVLSANGRLVTLDPPTGRVLSEHDLTRGLPKELRGAVPTRPFLVSDTHVFTGSRRGAVMAFERETGKCVWSHRPKDAAETVGHFALGNARLYYADMSDRMHGLMEDVAEEAKAVLKAGKVKEPGSARPAARDGSARARKKPSDARAAG